MGVTYDERLGADEVDGKVQQGVRPVRRGRVRSPAVRRAARQSDFGEDGLDVRGGAGTRDGLSHFG